MPTLEQLPSTTCVGARVGRAACGVRSGDDLPADDALGRRVRIPDENLQTVED
jgi:hypothetical protein